MQIYLVGGAVRDQLLGLPVKERDWVVIGATPEEMISQGYKQVGRDFPVFLHPKTSEEYALARTERKTGKGYYGFQCEFSPAVTLEEDLLRRDLTINAMAMDQAGTLIDPYGGLSDLEKKQLRHVSSAFVEDPVRVLRLARFKARFESLGFKVADETRLLAYNMVKQGELTHLVSERVWQEWERSLGEPHPEAFIMTLRQIGALEIILPELDVLFGVPDKPHYHPEIDTGVHVLQVLQRTRAIAQDPILAFTACLHDLGKAKTSKIEWPSHQGHDASGVKVVQALCDRLRVPNVYRDAALLACAYHLKIHRASELMPEEIVHILVAIGAFRERAQFDRLMQLCQADSRDLEYPQRAFWERCLKRCAEINIAELVAQGLSGKEMKEALYQARLAAVKQELV